MTYRRPAPAHLPIVLFCGLSPKTSGCRGSDIKQRQTRPRPPSSSAVKMWRRAKSGRVDDQQTQTLIWNNPLFSPAVCSLLLVYLAKRKPPQRRLFVWKTYILFFFMWDCVVVVLEVGLLKVLLTRLIFNWSCLRLERFLIKTIQDPS